VCGGQYRDVPQSRQRLRGSFVTCRQFGQVHTDQSVRALCAAGLETGVVAVMVLMGPPLVRRAAGPQPHADDARHRA
jgi:hypothetical protein